MTSETGRRHRIVAIATAASVTVAMALLIWRPLVALGFIGGVITGAGMLSALVIVLNRIVVPPGEREGHSAPWVVLHVTKFALAAAFAYLVIEILHGDLVAFAGGYTVTLATLLVVMSQEPSVSNGLSGDPESTSERENNNTQS